MINAMAMECVVENKMVKFLCEMLNMLNECERTMQIYEM
jgi:hypothetical protein